MNKAKSKSKVTKNSDFPKTTNYDRVLVLLFIVFFIFLNISKLNGEDDFFWHISTGKYIIENKVIPDVDVFGFVTQGQPWIPFEWLWDVSAYLIFSLTGFSGLYIINIIIGLLLFSVFFFLLRKFDVPLPLNIFALLILALAIRYRLEIKPHMVSYLLFTILMGIIISFRYLNLNKKYLFIIPVIFMFWANFHMGVSLGLLLFGIFILVTIYEHFRLDRYNRQIIYQLLLIFLLSLIAMLINPHHIYTFIYAYKHTQMKLIDSIYEWMSPFNQNFLGKFFNILYILFLVGFLPVLIHYYKRKDYFFILSYLVFGLYSLTAVRFIIEFIIVALIPLVLIVKTYLLKNQNRISFISKALLPKVILAALLTLMIVLIPDGKLFRVLGFAKVFGIGIYEETFPVKVFDFIKEHNIQQIAERPYNSIDYGGFFLWNFWGKKNFIDSRNLNDSIYFSFVTLYNRLAGYEKLISQFAFDYFIVFQPTPYAGPTVQMIDAALGTYLDKSIINYLSQKDDEWKLIYWDDKTHLFVKNEPKFNDLIEKYEYKYLKPYNIYHKPAIIKSAIQNYQETISQELQRKIIEEPNGFLMAKYKAVFGKK